METQLGPPTPNDSAQEKRKAKVPVARPSPAHGTTPTSTATPPVRSDAVLSPISADLPVGKTSVTTGTTISSLETAGDGSKENGGDPCPVEVTVGQLKTREADGNMAAIRPGFPLYPVSHSTFCPPYMPTVSSSAQTILTTNGLCASSAPLKCGPILPNPGNIIKVGPDESAVKHISPTLRVVSPNSVPVKKRSAFRAETDNSFVDRCIQKEGGVVSQTLPQVDCSRKIDNSKKVENEKNPSPEANEQQNISKQSKEEQNSSTYSSENKVDQRLKNDTDIMPTDYSGYKTTSNVLQAADDIDLTLSAKRSKLVQEEGATGLSHSENKNLTSGLVKQVSREGERTDASGNNLDKPVVWSPTGITTQVGKEEIKTAGNVDTRHNLVTTGVSDRKETSPVYLTNEASKVGPLKGTETAGGKTNPSSNNSTDSSPKSLAGQLHGGTTPSSHSCYPPLYLPSTCQVSLGRESNRVHKDGSKVHATTFVPDLGEFIPGPASSTREPPSRGNKNGQLGGDSQMVKVTDSSTLKGNVQNNFKNGKENKKGSRHAGHVEHSPSKIPKKEGKRSPSGGVDRTISKMVSQSSGIKMTEASSKLDKRTESYGGVDVTRKARDVGHVPMAKSPSAMKVADLSIVTQHPYGYQPLLSVGGSPPGQKSLSPRDRKSSELRGTGGEMTDKHRQMIEWQMAAASQHGIFYEPHHMWSPTGFGAARTTMMTSHSSTVSTQESVLRSALLHGGQKHHGTNSHTTTAMTSPKMTAVEAPHKVEPSDAPKPKREEPKKSHTGKMNFAEIGSGRGTPNSKSSDSTSTRNPPVGIALVQQRQETERKTDSRGSTGSSHRDRSDERRHRDSSRTTFSPIAHRDSRGSDSHREHRSSSNPSQPSLVSHHNSNLAVTGGSPVGSHAQEYLAHHTPFPPFPPCYPRFPPGHASPSQPLWLPQPYTMPAAAHGSSSLSSTYQDVPLPGNVGIQGREGLSGRHVVMLPPHLSTADGALHGLGAWPSPYLLPSALHPQLSSLNPSLYAQFAHLPQGGSSMTQPLHILSGQSDSHPQMGSELHAILQQQEALFHWYRAAELHSRHSPFPAMSHGDPIHASSQQQGSDHSRKHSIGRKSTESKSDMDKKQLKSENREQDSCGRTSREVVEEKITHSAPPIMPAFPPVIPGPAMPLFYPSHPLPYILDPTKSHIVPPHSSSPTTKVEKKDAGTSSHSPAGRPASRDRQKFPEAEVKGSDGSLKTACVQTLPPDNIGDTKKDGETEVKEDAEQTEKVDQEIIVGEAVLQEDAKVDIEIVAKETEDVHVEVEEVSNNPEPDEKVEVDSEQNSKSEQKDSQVPPQKENLSEKCSQVSTETTADADTVDPSNEEDKPPTTCDSGSETWLTNYSSCLDGQRRESLITSVMTTTQSVASKLDSMDQEQLAAIEGIALLSEVAEQKTFEAICKRKDEISEAPVESDGKERSQGQSGTIETLSKEHETDISPLQPPQDLSVSINTEEMKINKLVELQRKFKEKKKEYDKLQRKKEKKERVEKSSEETKKRGPGRPRKRKNSQRGKKNEDSPSEKRESQSNTLQSSADVLLEAAASLEEPIVPAKKKKKEKKEKKSKTKKEPVEDSIREDMSTCSMQSSADILLEAAASLEQPPPPVSGKKKKKEKREKKTKSKRESVGDVAPKEGKDSKKKKKKLSKKKDTEDVRDLQSEGKVKKKTKRSLSSSEVSWPSASLSGLTTSSLTKKKVTTKSSEKKRKSSKIKTGILPNLPQTIDELPAPVGASLPMYGEQKSKSKQIKGGLSISHVYGDSSDSDDEGSSQTSSVVVPKGLALLVSSADLSSGHSTPVKKPVKKEKVLTKKQSKSKTEEKVMKKRPLTDEAAASVKKLKLSKKKDKLKLQKSLKKEKKVTKKVNQKSTTESVQTTGSVTTPTPKFDAESWSRRRSERIFLNDTSPQQSRDVSPLSKPSEGGKIKIKLSMGSPNKMKVEAPAISPGLSNIGTVLDALKTDPFQMRKKFSRMSESDNEEEGVSDSESQDSKTKMKLKTKNSRDKLSMLYNEIDADSESSDSEAEDMPLSSFVDKPTEPAPRICNLRKDDLNEGQRVLVPLDNLFYEGKIHPIRPPDVYGVILDRRRGNRPHVYSQEQILQEVIADVKPNSIKYLPEGTRICAYWSQQYNCLYPGTVVKGSPNPSGDKKLVTVEFDDGDSGRIPLSHVRMLPQDYPVISDLSISSIPLERRLRQRNTETSCNLDEMKDEDEDDDQDERTGGGSFKTSGKMRKNKQLSQDGDDDVFLPNDAPVVKSPRGRKPKAKPPAKRTKALQSAPTVLSNQGGPVKKGRGRPRKIRPEDQVVGQPPKKGRPRKKPLSGSVTIAKKINKFYAGRKKAAQSKLIKPTTGARPRGRPPGSSKKGKKAKSQSCTVETKTVFSSEILDPAQAAMLRYNGPDDSEDAGTIGESDIWSQDEEEVTPKKGKGSKNSKIAAFLPERQLWRWLGNATQRKGSKGKAKKVFYKAIVRGKEVIRVNECAVFLSTGRPHLPYVGRIESMWESWGGIMVVRVKWFYHPEETKGCAANHEGKMALYQSSHVDENDIQTISHKCEVIPREEYKLRAMGKIPKNSVIDNDDVYYLAGTYDPTTGRMSTFQ